LVPKEVSFGFARWDNGTVMVVDDSNDIREMICIQLRRRGYRVVGAANGEEAVELVQRSEPGLILMDLSMPVMDGYEATRRIKALPMLGGVPVVAVSASSDSRVRSKALEAGCIDRVSKPIDLVTIDGLVSRHFQAH
jgi:CheY-like chemotaxis protein